MAIRWNDIVLGDDRRVCSSSGVKPKSNVLAKKRGGRGGRVAMVSEGGLTLPHPEAPRFLTLILSANHRHFPLSSFLLLLLLLPMPFHARPCTPSPFSPTFPTFQLQPSQELLYSLDSPRRRPSTFFPSLLPPSSHEPRRHLNSFGELLIPRIDTNFQPVSIALSRVRSVPSERRNSSEPSPCVYVCVCVCVPRFVRTPRANGANGPSEAWKSAVSIGTIRATRWNYGHRSNGTKTTIATIRKLRTSASTAFYPSLFRHLSSPSSIFFTFFPFPRSVGHTRLSYFRCPKRCPGRLRFASAYVSLISSFYLSQIYAVNPERTWRANFFTLASFLSLFHFALNRAEAILTLSLSTRKFA